MKIKAILLTSVLLAVLLVGCGNKATIPTPTTSVVISPAPTASPTTAPSASTTTKAQTKPDVVTTASIVDNEAAFQKAISKDGTWIIAIVKDLSINKELLLEGDFTNGKKDATTGKDVIQRKIALYAQDENRKITARYILTAPKLTVTSPQASIQHGTFKGDLYISVKNFSLIDTKVDGNVYFTSDDAKATFKQDATSSVTGKKELKK